MIAFNHGTALSGVNPSQALAWSSGMSFLDTNQNGNLDAGKPRAVCGGGVHSLVGAPSTWYQTET